MFNAREHCPFKQIQIDLKEKSRRDRLLSRRCGNTNRKTRLTRSRLTVASAISGNVSASTREYFPPGTHAAICPRDARFLIYSRNNTRKRALFMALGERRTTQAAVILSAANTRNILGGNSYRPIRYIRHGAAHGGGISQAAATTTTIMLPASPSWFNLTGR